MGMANLNNHIVCLNNVRMSTTNCSNCTDDRIQNDRAALWKERNVPATRVRVVIMMVVSAVVDFVVRHGAPTRRRTDEGHNGRKLRGVGTEATAPSPSRGFSSRKRQPFSW